MDKENVNKLIERRAWRDLLQTMKPDMETKVRLPFPSSGMSIRVAASKLNADPNCAMRYKVNVKFNEGIATVTPTRK